jgi:nicotinate-nucleotide pyrophosphorylase (carboxylating)
MEEAQEALEARADIILLDNMAPEEMRRVVEMIGGRAVVEASGGITLENIAGYGRSGVDCVSVGYMTNSAPCLDMGLDVR